MIVSIDIGTSYSSISMLDPDDKAQPIDIGTGVSMFGSKFSLPSAVFVEDDGRVLLGQDALNNRMRNPQRFRDEFKRNLGETIPIMLGSRSFLPEELYTEFFRHMKGRAEKVSGEQIELAYLTHPAAYSSSKKNRILAAAKAAGLYDVELVDEPAAAAMSYCAAGYIKNGQNLLIYDFGGGTFDTAVIRYENDSFTLLTQPKGLERCGGIDIDRLIFQNMLSKVDLATLDMLRANNLHYMRFVSQLSELAVKCKHQLSSPEVDSFFGYIQVGFDMVPYTLTLDQYNQMIAGMVGQTIQTCRQVLEDAKLKVSDLSAVLLVGGTSRVRLVREMVEQMAGKVPVFCAADLELAVSQGALNYRNYKTVEPEPDPAPDVPDVKDDSTSKAQVEFQRGRKYAEEGNWDDAYLCFYEASKLGSGEAMYELACCHKHGLGTDVDLSLAEIWFEEAAERGVLCATPLIGKEKKTDVVAGTPNEAHAEFLKGRKFAREDRRDAAFKCFFKAAKMGDTEAMYSLANCYKMGYGTDKYAALADIWYRRATEARISPEVQSSTEHTETKTKNVVFSVHNTMVNCGNITVSGNLCGKNALVDGEFVVAFDSDGKSLGTCKVRTYVGREQILSVTEDTKDVTIELVNFTGRVHDKLDIDYLISMPVSESTYDQVFADLEQDGYYTTRVSYVYEDPDSSIDLEDAYFFYVTEVKDGKIHGRSLTGSFSGDSEMYVYSKNKPNSYLKRLKWKEHTATGHNAFFDADSADVQVGDILTDCVAPPGFTFKCKQLSFWRYRLIIAVQNRNAVDCGSIEHVEDPKMLDEMGLDFSRKGQWRVAFEAYQKAANRNYAPAQYHLAGCYERGNGTVVDWSNAKIWYHRAAAQGHPAAADKLKQLEKPKMELTPRKIFQKLVLQFPELRSASDCWISESKNIPVWLSRLQSNTNVRDRSSILLAQDTTLFSSGKEGIIFTEKGIHVYGGWLAPLEAIDWMTFAKRTLTMQSREKFAYLNDHLIAGSNFLPKGFWPRLHEEIKKLYRY